MVMARELWLIRHGETEWSLSGAHTGRTDLPLTAEGERKAAGLRARLAGHNFALVLTSPLQRARRTCELAGFGASAQIDPDLLEWDYGAYEGLSTDDIHRERPGWSLFRDGVPGGETIGQVALRARAVIERAVALSPNAADPNAAEGDVALFAHGHILRILTACWLELPPEAARFFALGTAGISTLGHERETRVIVRWNLQ
jgi:broad specificity phosphatase PhoE